MQWYTWVSALKICADSGDHLCITIPVWNPQNQYNTSASHPCLTLAHTLPWMIWQQVTSSTVQLLPTIWDVRLQGAFLLQVVFPPEGLWTCQKLVYCWSPPGALRRRDMIWQHWYWLESQETFVSVAGGWTRHVAGKRTSEIVTEQRYFQNISRVLNLESRLEKRSPPCSCNFSR